MTGNCKTHSALDEFSTALFATATLTPRYRKAYAYRFANSTNAARFACRKFSCNAFVSAPRIEAITKATHDSGAR